MRPVTRKVTAAIVLCLLGLLALGVVPSLLGSGPAYRMTAEPVEPGPAYQLTIEGDLDRQRFEYFVSAVERDGASKPYRKGPVGIKEQFTHSPFDELDSFRTFAPANATEGDAVFVQFEDTRYRVAVVANGTT